MDNLMSDCCFSCSCSIITPQHASNKGHFTTVDEMSFENCFHLAKIANNVFARQEMTSHLLPHTLNHTHIHITSHHGRRLCEPFNICLNNAAAFHKPGVVPRLTPPAAARARDIRNIYFSPSSVAVISLFSPFYFSSLWPPFPVSPPAAPLIIRCTYCSLLLPRLPPFFSLWLSGSLLLLYKKVWIQM